MKKLLAGLALALLIASPVAARPATGTVTATPNPVSVGAPLTVVAEGGDWVRVTTPCTRGWQPTGTTTWTLYCAGEAVIDLFDGRRVIASTTVTVTE